MIIIAFDASINNTGYAIADSEIKDSPKSLLKSGTLKIIKPDSVTLVEKVAILAVEVDNLCKFFKPDVIIIEKALAYAYKGRKNYYGKALNVNSMALNALSVGVIAGAVSKHSVNIKFVSAQEWKGMQRKEVTRLVVNNEYNLKLKRVNNDEVDAIGIASWYRRELKFKKMMRK